MINLRKFCLSAIVSLSALCASAIVPQVDYTPYFITVDEVHRAPDCLRMDVTLNHLPHYWVKIDSTSVLKDPATGREFRLIGQENIPFNTEIWMPDSGHHSGTLLFEPVPDGIKVVDFIEGDSSPKSHTYGIHLDTPRAESAPGGLTLDDILSLQPHAEKWMGLNPDNYRRMDFVTPGATTLVRGHIAHHEPRTGTNTVTITTRNLITDKDTQTVAEIDPAGDFSIAVPVDYPQMALVRYGDMTRNVFLCPNDTFNIYTSALMHFETEPYRRLVPEYLRYESANPDAAAISLVYGDAEAKFATNEFGYQRISQATDEGIGSVMALGEEIKAKMRRLVAEAPAEIDRYPLSPRAKDLLYTYILIDTYTNMMDLPLYWKDHDMLRVGESENGYPLMRPNPDFVPIDVWQFHGGEQAYAPLIFDNPLAMCASWVFFNRCEYDNLFIAIGNIANGSIKARIIDGKLEADPATCFDDGESRYERVRELEKIRRDSCGIGDCFMQQLIIAKNLSQKLSTNAVLTPEGMEFNTELVSDILPLLTYPPLVRQVVDDWADINREIGRMEGNTIADNTRSVDTESDVLAAVIEPYRGNVIYVDVWDMGCGPCRAGMLLQRELIKKTADKPLTVIYLNTEDEKDQAERWMRNNDIHGEHVYLSADNRARLSADFNIIGIPYGILIDKQGNIRQTNLHGLSLDDTLLQQLLAE